jgi:hypothetical protein
VKRPVFLSFLGLLILVAGTSGYAEIPPVDIRISGFIDMVSLLFQNIAPGTPGQAIYSRTTPPLWPPSFPSPFSGGWNHTAAWMESRARLKFDASMGKALSGTIFLEMDSFRWGDEPVNALTLSQSGTMGFWGADRPAVEVKNVYFDVALPYVGIPVPMMLRFGVQPLYLRPYIFAYTDGAGIGGAIKLDPVTISPMWLKPLEGKDASADDVDVYALNVFANAGELTFGGFGAYYNMNTYPLNQATAVYGDGPPFRADMLWLGLYAEGKVGPVELNFDVVYDHGEVKKAFSTQVPDVTYQGWASRLTINHRWDKFNLGTTFMYASGADQKKTSQSGLPGSRTPYHSNTNPSITSDVDSYVIPPGSEQWAGGESLIVYGSWIARSEIGFFVFPNTAASSLTRGSWGGTWFAKLFAGYKLTSWYKVSIEAFYIGDTTKNGNTLGNATRANGLPRDDKTIGIELDWIHNFLVYQNLKFDVGLGYLFTGSALEQAGRFGENASFKNPWIIATHLTYEF